jgi:hypothetical protein
MSAALIEHRPVGPAFYGRRVGDPAAAVKRAQMCCCGTVYDGAHIAVALQACHTAVAVFLDAGTR